MPSLQPCWAVKTTSVVPAVPWLRRAGAVREADLTQRALSIAQNLPNIGKLRKKIAGTKRRFLKWEFRPSFLSSAPAERLCSEDDAETAFCCVLCEVGFYICDNHQVILFLGTRLFYNKRKDSPSGILAITSWRKTASKHSTNITICPKISLVLIHTDWYLHYFTVRPWLCYAYNCFFQL